MNKMFNEKRERYYRRQVIKAIGLHNTQTAFGAEKTCYVFNNFVVFKDQVHSDEGEEFTSVLITKLIKQQNANYLHNAGIHTPRIVDIHYEDGYIYEIQEKAPGSVLSYTNESNIINTFAGKDSKYVSIRDMSDYLRSDFCKQILIYNFNMQKKLKSAPISHFVDFIRSFKTIQEYGLNLDIHGENFLYDVNVGFSFIDLPAIQYTEKKKFSPENIDTTELCFDNKRVKSVEKYRKVNDFTILTQICTLFVDFLKYTSYVFDTELIKQMRKNNLAIIKNKILPAAKLAGLTLTKQDWMLLENYIKEISYSKGNDSALTF